MIPHTEKLFGEVPIPDAGIACRRTGAAFVRELKPGAGMVARRELVGAGKDRRWPLWHMVWVDQRPDVSFLPCSYHNAAGGRHR